MLYLNCFFEVDFLDTLIFFVMLSEFRFRWPISHHFREEYFWNLVAAYAHVIHRPGPQVDGYPPIKADEWNVARQHSHEIISKS